MKRLYTATWCVERYVLASSVLNSPAQGKDGHETRIISLLLAKPPVPHLTRRSYPVVLLVQWGLFQCHSYCLTLFIKSTIMGIFRLLNLCLIQSAKEAFHYQGRQSSWFSKESTTVPSVRYKGRRLRARHRRNPIRFISILPQHQA